MVTLREEIAEFEKLSSQTYQYDSYDAGETLSAQKAVSYTHLTLPTILRV